MNDPSQPEYVQPPVRADGPILPADPRRDWAAQYADAKSSLVKGIISRAQDGQSGASAKRGPERAVKRRPRID